MGWEVGNEIGWDWLGAPLCWKLEAGRKRRKKKVVGFGWGQDWGEDVGLLALWF